MSYATTLGHGHETIRFRGKAKEPKPDADGNFTKPKRWVDRHTTLMVDQVRRSAQPPWIPSLSLAFRIFIFLRFTAAMYTGITDCDEVFNFWEPLHYLSKNTGFQTWELSPVFAVRSWAYIASFLPAAEIIPFYMNLGKRQAFFCVRIFQAFFCAYVEARFFRAIVQHVNDRAGRYYLFSMLFSAGMWNAATAFLPSTTTLHTTLLAYSFYLEPTASNNNRRVYLATFFFAFGALFAWPFSLLLAVPFVAEELLLGGKDLVFADGRVEWFTGRIVRLIKAGLVASLIAIPIVLVDSHAYGRITFPTLNIILYNIFSTTGGSPDLYGTSPASFYLRNLFLNFNFLLPLALLSLPVLVLTHQFDYKRLGSKQRKPQEGETSAYALMFGRLSGFYLWLGVMSWQAHKEERFMYPAYPLLGFNAAVTLFLLRGLVERAYIKITKSPYKASETTMFANITLLFTLGTMIISVSRIFAIQTYYVAPLRASYHLEYTELPLLLSSLGHIPIQHNGTNDWDEWDLRPIQELNEGAGLRLCYGKEWHRFTSSWLAPDGIEVRWVKSEFDGALPKRWEPSKEVLGGWWRRQGTREQVEGLNDLNKEEFTHYVDPSTCDYFMDSTFPLRNTSSLEPAYTLDTETWERLHCAPFLDAENSKTIQRAFWAPGSWWGAEDKLAWGEFCLLGRRKGREALRAD